MSLNPFSGQTLIKIGPDIVKLVVKFVQRMQFNTD